MNSFIFYFKFMCLHFFVFIFSKNYLVLGCMQEAQSLGNLVELINKIKHYLHTFYNGLLYSTRIILDVAA